MTTMDSCDELNDESFLSDEEKASIEKLRQELKCSKDADAVDVIKKAIRLIQQLAKMKEEQDAAAEEMEANN